MSESAIVDPNADDTKPAASQTDDDILDEARKNYKAWQDAGGENCINAIADLNFLVGGENQWDAAAVAARKADGRPMITVNSLPTYLHQVTNDQRMNTPAIKVHPVDDNADLETAKVRQGLIRHIEYDSNADVAYDTSVNSAAAVGFGYWRLITDYESESSFDQKIMYQRIRNALSVKMDPLSVEADGSDQRFCFIELKMSKDAFKREWPKAEACTSSIFSGDSSYAGWLTDTEVLVCDYYRIEKTEAEVVLLSNGESGFKDDLIEMPAGVTIVKTRKGERSKTMLYKITGVDILERTEIKCKWIPVFPVYGDELDIEGKIVRSGIIRHAKGPAQMYNVMMTAATEEVSLRAKSPYIGAEGQFEGHEDEWTQANNRAFPYLEYKPTSLEGRLVPPPQRNPMADVPTGMLSLAMHASDNVKKTTGLFDASLGAKGTATSGVQEKAQQREGDVANYHYMDGLLRTIRHCGRCLNCMIPYYYDTERAVRIMGEDDSADYATINQPNRDQTKSEDGAIRSVLNDMTCGEYDITVSAGPSYSTLRQESAEGMGRIMEKNPAAWGVFGDLYVRSQDWPNAEEIAERVKKTIPPNLLEGEDEEAQPVIQTPKGPLPVAQVPQVLQQLEAQLLEAGEALKQAQGDKQHSEVLKQQNEQITLKLDAERIKIEQFNAETARLKVQADAEASLHNARAAATTAETDHMNAQISALREQQQIEVDGALARAEALNGDTTAFEAWKATLEADTKIRVAEIMASSRERASKQRGNDNGKTI